MTLRLSLGTVIIAVAFAALGAGVAAGVMAWEPWDGDGDDDEVASEAPPTPVPAKPTPYQRRLTGAEAARIVETTVNREAIQGFLDRIEEAQEKNQEPPPPSHFLLDDCKSVDFNEFQKAWIVECEAALQTEVGREPIGLGTLTYRLFDATKEVEQVG